MFNPLFICIKLCGTCRSLTHRLREKYALTIVISVLGSFGGDCVVVLVAAAAIALTPLGFVEEVDEEPQRFRGLPRLLLHPSTSNVKMSLPNIIP